MYDFHYNFIKRTYGDNATLLFTDTDSLCYDITCSDFYEGMMIQHDKFDTSDYPIQHKAFSHNKKVVGKMKDEMASIPITEFIGLKAKMYSLKTSTSQKKTAKGVPRVALKKQITRDI